MFEGLLRDCLGATGLCRASAFSAIPTSPVAPASLTAADSLDPRPSARWPVPPAVVRPTSDAPVRLPALFCAQ